MYSQYVQSYDEASKILATYRDHTKYIDFESQQCLQYKVQLLSSLLIMPVQRVPRYRLLIKELLKNTVKEHVDYNSLQAALKSVKKVASHINEMIRAQENRNKILSLQEEFGGEQFTGHLRTFIKYDMLTKRSRKDESERYHFFLFSDLLVYAKDGTVSRYKLQRKIPIDKVFQLVDIQDDRINPFDPNIKAQVVHLLEIVNSVKSITVEFNSLDSKNEWIEALVSCALGIRAKKDNPNESNYIAPIWKKDTERTHCPLCNTKFNLINRRHHCRKCGELCCNDCSLRRVKINQKLERICDLCDPDDIKVMNTAVYDRNAVLSTRSLGPKPLAEIEEREKKYRTYQFN